MRAAASTFPTEYCESRASGIRPRRPPSSRSLRPLGRRRPRMRGSPPARSAGTPSSPCPPWISSRCSSRARHHPTIPAQRSARGTVIRAALDSGPSSGAWKGRQGDRGGDGASARSGAGDRLRRAVRPADRPPGPRGPGLLRDRAAHPSVAEIVGQAAEGDHPLRRTAVGVRAGRPAGRPGLFTAGLPVFGICYGFQAMARALGGDVARTGLCEFGRTQVDDRGGRHAARRPAAQQQVWMSHGDSVAARRPGSPRWPAPRAPRSPPSRTSTGGLAGVQWHPEVLHTQPGQQVLERFLYDDRRLHPGLDDGQHRRRLRSTRSGPRSATSR